ncbi:MAG: transposase [Terriglobia bacterium]
MDESRRRLGFLLCGYVRMPDHWHALIGESHPRTISRVVQSIKWISARRLNDKRCAEDLTEIEGAVRGGMERIRGSGKLPFSFLKHAGLSF